MTQDDRPGCCDCASAEYGNCFDCLNTGHTHAADDPCKQPVESQYGPRWESVYAEQAWDEGFEAGADFREYQVGPSGIPQDPPLNPYRRPAAREPVTQDDREALLVEGEPERLHESPIGLSYNEDGVLVVTYEPTWADIATRLAAHPFVPTVTAEQVREAAEVLWNHYGDDDPDASHAALSVTRDMFAALGIEVQP